MKKKAFIIPACCIIISLVLSVFLVRWASPFGFYMRSYCFEIYADEEAPESEAEFTERIEKLCNFADKVYSISPNESTLYMMVELYGPENFYILENRKMPDGFFDKCVKYTKMDMETVEQTGNIDWQIGWLAVNDIVGVVRGGIPDYSEFMLPIRYSLALYLNSQTEEAQKVLDKCIADFKNRDIENSKLSYAYFRLYFEIAYATALERGENTDWILERELDITQFEKANNTNLIAACQSLDNLFVNRSFEQLKADNYEYIR